MKIEMTQSGEVRQQMMKYKVFHPTQKAYGVEYTITKRDGVNHWSMKCFHTLVQATEYRTFLFKMGVPVRPNILVGTYELNTIRPGKVVDMEPIEDTCQQIDCNNRSTGRRHTCPFKEDVDNDSRTLCNCCKACQDNCADEI